MKPSLLLTAVLLLSSTAASAATYAFSYLSDPIQLSGRMTGTLLGDGNTFVVSGVSDIFLNGEDKGPHPEVIAIPDLGGPLPTVTLDGSAMDIAGCTIIGSCTYGFIFSTSPIVIEQFGAPLFRFFYPGMPEVAGLPYDSAGWSMTPINGAVPEPDSWALLIAGFGLVGATLRRRKALPA